VRVFNFFAWLRNRRILSKLFLMMLLMIGILVAVGLEGTYSMSRLKPQLNALATLMEGGQAIFHLRTANLQAERLQKRLILADSPAERARLERELERKVLDIDGASRAFLRFHATPEQQAKFKTDLMPLIGEWSRLNEEILALARQNKAPEALALSDSRAQSLMSTIVDVKLDELIVLGNQEVERQKALAETEYRNALIRLIASIAVAMALAMGIAFLFAHQIADPLRQLITRLRDIAEGEGDLSRTLEVDRRDEIGELALWFNRFLVQLRDMVAQIDSVSSRLQQSSEALAQSADETGTGAHQVSRTMEQLAIGATEQVQGITKSSDEALAVAHAAEKVSANAAIAAQSSQQAAAAAAAGDRILHEALNHMDAVQGVFTDSAGVVERLGALGQQIQAIVTLIGGFAKRTNLLALNAGIEAARVGNQGLAFSVLAQEIRKLAVESGNAAQHIAELVSNIQEETRRAVSVMHEGSEGVTQGAAIIHEAGDAFERVVSSIQRTDDEIRQIREAAQQLAQSAEIMVREMDTIANISEQSAAGAQQVAATALQQTSSVERVSGSAQGLTKLSTELRGLVTRFRL
jgi:methyl-accepting chemotaxis protein